jgi:hypothetical protein
LWQGRRHALSRIGQEADLPELRRALSQPHTFTAVIFGENRAKFGTPEKDYLDREICITGKIEDYNGKPEIIVTEPQQIKAASK